MATDRRTILVSGGGIAGLSAALALVETGHRIEVFEKTKKFETVGAGIQLSPNALRVLFDLGLEKPLKSIATIPGSIQIMDAYRGDCLSEIPLGPAATQRYGTPYLVIHRADLHNILLNACNEHPEIDVQTDCHVADIAIHPNGVTALVNQRDEASEYVGKALVAADGVHSRIRTQTFNLEPATKTRYVAWRTLVPVEASPLEASRNNTQLWLGRNAHAVTYPVRSKRYLNVVAIIAGNQLPVDITSVDALRNRFTGWHGNFSRLFDTGAQWSAWPIHEIRKLGKMALGPAVLIGDAAHAMLPFAAQGAAMAIEDAAVLAQQIDFHATIEEALTTFERRRLPRLKKIIALGRSNARIYHMRQPFALGRDVALRLIPGNRLLSRQDWLYKWQV